ncbi:MAG: hypothetical protein ACFCBW_14195 [Candidatus Competibacterales bacterium]
MNKWLVVMVVIALGQWWWSWEGSVELGPGVMAPDPPWQKAIARPEAFYHNGYRVTPLAEFHTVAKVLAKKTYRWDAEAALSPVDLGLGWGRMSDEQVLAQVTFRQGGRFLFHQWDQAPPIPPREMASHLANLHVVPAQDYIERAIQRARVGELIELNGYLVRIDRDDGWFWQSSLTRDDTGAGACELVWVESFRVVNPG